MTEAQRISKRVDLPAEAYYTVSLPMYRLMCFNAQKCSISLKLELPVHPTLLYLLMPG